MHGGGLAFGALVPRWTWPGLRLLAGRTIWALNR